MSKKYRFGECIPAGYIYGQKIDERHIEEAAQIILQYPSYESLVEKYEQLIGETGSTYGFQSVQRLAAAKKLKEIGQRGLDIHAWSTTYDGTESYLAILTSDDAICKAFAGNGPGLYADYYDGHYKWNKYAGVVFSLPTCGTLVELYLRLKNGSDGEGVIGIPSNYGYIFMGTEQPFNAGLAGPNASAAIYIWRKDCYTVGVKHGAYNMELSMGIVLSYLHSIIEDSFDSYRAVSIAGRIQLSRTLQNLLDTLLPGDNTAELFQDILNAGARLGASLWARIAGREEFRHTDQLVMNTAYRLEGYQPFGGPVDMVVCLPGYQEMINSSQAFSLFGKSKFGDTWGPGSKELFADSKSVMELDSGKLAKPESAHGLKLIERVSSSSFKIKGVNGTVNDKTIQKPSDWQDRTGADADTIVYWAFASNCCGVLNNCSYSLGD